MSADTMTKADIVLTGRKVVGGVAEGEALVTRDTISGWGGVNAMTGTVIESRHELRGRALPARSWSFPAPRDRRAGRRCSTWPASPAWRRSRWCST